LELRDCGFANLLGVDPFIPAPISYQGGVQINHCELEDVRGEFSLVMFHHVFEHLANPMASLKKARELLSKDGQILIRIPLSDSMAAQKYNEKWVQLDAPRHITLQTRKSMDYIAQKLGLKITKITYDSTDLQFWGSEQYLADIPLFDPRSHGSGGAGIFLPAQIEAFTKESEVLNKQEKGDQAAFVFEKASAIK
jgi:SAM-dependent methyltransferase